VETLGPLGPQPEIEIAFVPFQTLKVAYANVDDLRLSMIRLSWLLFWKGTPADGVQERNIEYRVRADVGEERLAAYVLTSDGDSYPTLLLNREIAADRNHTKGFTGDATHHPARVDSCMFSPHSWGISVDDRAHPCGWPDDGGILRDCIEHQVSSRYGASPVSNCHLYYKHWDNELRKRKVK